MNTLDALDLRGKNVLVRVDFNVPLETKPSGRIAVTDDTRIRAALPTIEHITKAGATAVLMSHLGRPGGQTKPALSLGPVARHLGTLIDAPVTFIDQTVGPRAEQAVALASERSVIVLENTRFLPGEKKNDADLAAQMGRLGDIFVNDAFGSAHRAHASTEGVTHHMDTYAMGFLLGKEITYLSEALKMPKRPFVAILGGAKVSDKIGVIRALLDKVDALLIGGAMSYTFLKMLGQEVGSSLVENDKLDVARELYTAAHGKIKLPSDHIVATAFDNEAEHHTVQGNIPEGYMGLDIGPDTIAAYRTLLAEAQTVVWNGPMGVFEMPNYANGTLAVAQTLADITKQGAMTIVGGGDSVAAINKAGLEEEVSHVSTGGGAMLELLEGKALPGIAALG